MSGRPGGECIAAAPTHFLAASPCSRGRSARGDHGGSETCRSPAGFPGGAEGIGRGEDAPADVQPGVFTVLKHDGGGRDRDHYMPRSTDNSTASVHVMSTLSPTFTLPRAALSSTFDEYFQPFGPVNVIEGSAGSIAVIVAVIVRCRALAPPGVA